MKENIQPLHIVLFMAACLAVMGMLSLVLPKTVHVGNLDIRNPQLGEIFGIDSLQKVGDDAEEAGLLAEMQTQDSLPSAPVPEQAPAVEEKQPVTQAQPAVQEEQQLILPPPSAVAETSTEALTAVEDTFDTHVFLSAFYQALRTVSTSSIRVIHYGDSQIEEDRLTTQVRRALQSQYGGGGVGLIPLHQTIGTRTLWQATTMNGAVQSVNGGPKRYLVYGPKSYHRDGSVYGPMGQVAIMDNNKVAGSEDITLQVKAGSKNSTEARFNRIRVWGKGDINVTINAALEQQDNCFIMPDSTISAIMHLNGRGEIYGISLEKDHGVMVDNIPMRGCSGAVFTSIASTELKQYFTETGTRLIILQYGGNVMPYTTSRQQVRTYVEKMRTQIQYLKYLAPSSSILFVGPSDMCQRKNGQMQTYPMIPVMDQALRQMAIDEEIGYFSLYQHMGGKGSMVHWKEQGLAGGDYVHFTRKGADKAGTMLAEWILNK